MATPKEFDFDKVYDKLIEQGGKIKLIYLNGIRTTSAKFQQDLEGFDKLWKLSGNLLVPNSSVPRGAIDLDIKYRNTTDSTGNDLGACHFCDKYLYLCSFSRSTN
ncbi:MULTISPECIES: hypothetical protein [unclassified Microcoleus]|uniref:hypothetical protein n=1 Tax=unclassified Microcoleus TaxID=2642155 RepID=UPI002FD2D0CE